MSLRLPRLLIAAFLCLMTYGSAAASPVSVWVALSDAGGVYGEAAEALRAEVERVHPGRIEWRVASAAELRQNRSEPQWVVAIGSSAQRAMQERFADDSRPPPMLAILVPRLTFERLADPARLRTGQLSAVFLDQPPARQLMLAQLAFPALRSLGILLGGESRGQAASFERAAREQGLQLNIQVVADEGLFGALQSVLQDVDALLAVPDPAVFNSQTAANILAAAYRRRIPMIGFSPAYTRAGALLSLYSTPAQVGTRAGEMLRHALPVRSLPPPQWPRDFVVGVNQDVSRSLGLTLVETQLAQQLRQRERRE
jgi:putative ABC transport system substrate-binding protein